MSSRFELWVDDQVRYSLLFDEGQGVAESEIIAASERQRCSFHVLDRMPGREYTISIGDESTEIVIADEVVDPSKTLNRSVWWKEETYFESGVGVVFATLYSRSSDEEDWERLASLRVNVLPSKIGSARYQKMFEDVSSLSAALVFDLISKNTRALSFRGPGIAFEPSNVQLRRIEEAWHRLSPALIQIEEMPATKIVRKIEQSSDPCLLNGRSISAALARGFRPGQSNTRFLVSRFSETSIMYEHDLIRTFLLALIERLSDCKRYAHDLHEEIRSSYPTFFTPEITANVVAQEVEPRLAKLMEMAARCDQLSALIRRALSCGVLRSARLVFDFKDSPILRNVRSYNAVFREMIEFRNKASWSLDTGQQERIKLTSRLYEHWLFIQTAAALRGLGFPCVESKGFFRPGERHRFILDIERGTELVFRLGPRLMLRLRYEPWILPRDLAEQSGELVFAPQRDPWNPDITLEFLKLRSDGESDGVDYVAVLDAKYSQFPSRSQREKVGRYAKIRSIKSRQAIAKQVWIVYPSDGPPRISDDSIRWGMNAQPDEAVEGIVGVRPEEKEQVPSTLLRFVRALLIFRGIDDLDINPVAWNR